MRVTLEGTVLCQNATVAVDARLEVDGVLVAQVARREPFTLDTAEGPVDVVIGPETALYPRERRRDRWGDLLDHPLAEAVERSAPGDHVKVVLEGARVAAGDPVVVRAEVVARADEGYRGGASGRIVKVRALGIAVGEEGRAELARAVEAETESAAEPTSVTPPAPVREPTLDLRPATLFAAIGIVSLAVCALGVLGEWGPRSLRPITLAIGLYAISVAVLIRGRRRFLPIFGDAGVRARGEGLPWESGGFAVGFGVLLAMALGITTVLFGLADLASGAVALGLVGSIGAIATALRLALADRRSARLLRLIAWGATATADGWGVREGTLRSGSFARRRTFTPRSSTTTHTTKDAKGELRTREVRQHWVDWQDRDTPSSTGTVALDRGGELEVELRAAHWASARRTVTLGPTPVLEETARAGDHVALLGRVAEGTMRGGGTESLVVLAVPNGSARSFARRAWLARSTAIFGLAIVGIAGSLLAWSNVFQTHRRGVARVVASSIAGVEPGDECVLTVGWHETDLGTRCQAHLRCGLRMLYGGAPMSGFMDCEIDRRAARGSDSDAEDGDEAIVFDATHVRTWRADGESVDAALDW